MSSAPYNDTDYNTAFTMGDAQISLPALEDAALERLYDKIRGGGNLIVDAAEGRATLKMLRNALSVKKLAKEFMNEVLGSKRYKRIRGKNRGQRQAQYLASKWLEYRYGWLPLIYSTYDLLEEIHRHRAGGYLLVKGRRARTFSETTRTGNGSYASPRDNRSVEFSRRCEIGVLFNFPEGSRWGDFTSLSPASIAWELTTLSFVADWFANIGQQLALWENFFLYSSNFRAGYKTITERERRTRHRNGQTTNPRQYSASGCLLNFTYLESMTAHGHTTAVRLNRTRLLGLPRPAGFRLETNLNSTRLLDAAALLAGQFKRR